MEPEDNKYRIPTTSEADAVLQAFDGDGTIQINRDHNPLTTDKLADYIIFYNNKLGKDPASQKKRITDYVDELPIDITAYGRLNAWWQANGPAGQRKIDNLDLLQRNQVRVYGSDLNQKSPAPLNAQIGQALYYLASARERVLSESENNRYRVFIKSSSNLSDATIDAILLDKGSLEDNDYYKAFVKHRLKDDANAGKYAAKQVYEISQGKYGRALITGGSAHNLGSNDFDENFQSELERLSGKNPGEISIKHLFLLSADPSQEVVSGLYKAKGNPLFIPLNYNSSGLSYISKTNIDSVFVIPQQNTPWQSESIKPLYNNNFIADAAKQGISLSTTPYALAVILSDSGYKTPEALKTACQSTLRHPRNGLPEKLVMNIGAIDADAADKIAKALNDKYGAGTAVYNNMRLDIDGVYRQQILISHAAWDIKIAPGLGKILADNADLKNALKSYQDSHLTPEAQQDMQIYLKNIVDHQEKENLPAQHNKLRDAAATLQQGTTGPLNHTDPKTSGQLKPPMLERIMTRLGSLLD